MIHRKGAKNVKLKIDLKTMNNSFDTTFQIKYIEIQNHTYSRAHQRSQRIVKKYLQETVFNVLTIESICFFLSVPSVPSVRKNF
jgi:hypothetical protein